MTHRIKAPPSALRRARLDNIAIVPGNLLSRMAGWQRILDTLPNGTVLIVAPKQKTQRDAAVSLARTFAKQGKAVRLVSPRVS